MKYLELTVRTTSEASEIVADILWNYTEGGVAVSDSADVLSLLRGESGVYWDYIDDSLREERKETLVKAFLQPSRAGEIPAIMGEIAAAKERAEGVLSFGTLEESVREIDGDDWIEIWKKHFRPIHIGRIVVVPEWIRYEKEAGEEIVTLDSNMAFGTGEHETTAMCVGLLQDYLKEGDVVLDVGCGSGILGISAAKLGASHCYLTDIDPVAVSSSLHNAEKNGVADRLTVTETDLTGGLDCKADLILANITAEILARLAPAILNYLKEGGTVILSGVIRERRDLVKSAYAAQGLFAVREENRGEWFAYVLKRS